MRTNYYESPLFKLNAFYLSSGDSFEDFVAQITQSNDKNRISMTNRPGDHNYREFECF